MARRLKHLVVRDYANGLISEVMAVCDSSKEALGIKEELEKSNESYRSMTGHCASVYKIVTAPSGYVNFYEIFQVKMRSNGEIVISKSATVTKHTYAWYKKERHWRVSYNADWTFMVEYISPISEEDAIAQAKEKVKEVKRQLKERDKAEKDYERRCKCARKKS